MPSKKSHIQLYADECFPVPSAIYLRSLGYSIVHAFDKKLIRKKDRIHLAEAKKLNRVVITVDRDFLYYNEINLNKHPGVIVVSVGSTTPIHINKVCLKLFKNISPDFVKNSLVKASIDKIVKTKNGKTVLKKIL